MFSRESSKFEGEKRQKWAEIQAVVRVSVNRAKEVW